MQYRKTLLIFINYLLNYFNKLKLAKFFNLIFLLLKFFFLANIVYI